MKCSLITNSNIKDEGVTRLAHSVAGGKSQELRACS